MLPLPPPTPPDTYTAHTIYTFIHHIYMCILYTISIHTYTYTHTCARNIRALIQ